MNLVPKSPRVGRSPKLKAKWLSNTLAYQYGTGGKKKNEIIVLSNDLDQYLQDIFQSIDTKGRGKITPLEYRLLCDVLNLRNSDVGNGVKDDVTFQDFHSRLCEHFACYGDYTGFLVNQNFRTINNDNDKDKKGKSLDMTKRTKFQKQMANAKSHRCIHDAELFRNWDKLRLSGFRLSEMREHIDQMLFEVAYHKEESQTLKEIIEDLRSMLQASDAHNIAMQVALKKQQYHLTTETDYVYMKSGGHRLSLPIDGSVVTYKPLKGEEKSARTLGRELSQLRELRDKEVNELISFNNQLQHDITDLSREICRLEDENRKLTGQLDLIVKTYNCCRELFAVCVESFKEVESGVIAPALEANDAISPLATPTIATPTRTPSLKRRFSFSSHPETNHSQKTRCDRCKDNISPDRSPSGLHDNPPPEAVLIKRLEHEIETLQESNASLQQDMARMDTELSMCRRHLQTANFQVEALETECSRLLSLEDHLVSVFTLLQKGRSQCLSRKTLGQLLLDVIDTSFGEDEQDMTADQFIRLLQKTLSDCPLFLFSN